MQNTFKKRPQWIEGTFLCFLQKRNDVLELRPKFYSSSSSISEAPFQNFEVIQDPDNLGSFSSACPKQTQELPYAEHIHSTEVPCQWLYTHTLLHICSTVRLCLYTVAEFAPSLWFSSAPAIQASEPLLPDSPGPCFPLTAWTPQIHCWAAGYEPPSNSCWILCSVEFVSILTQKAEASSFSPRDG